MQKFRNFFTYFVISIVFFNCYERKSGCLDPIASNYSISSDDPCDNCCIYPKLTLKTERLYGDSIFKTTDTLSNSFSQNYLFRELKMYFSSFSVLKPDGTESKVIEYIIDSLHNQTITDDVKIYNFKEETKTIGTIKLTGKIEGFTCRLGLDENLNDTNFNTVAKTHPLSGTSRLKDNKNQLIQALCSVVFIEGAISDTVQYFIPLDNNPNMYNFVQNSDFSLGQDVEIRLKLDFKNLFDDIDFKSDSLVRASQFIENFKTKFIVY